MVERRQKLRGSTAQLNASVGLQGLLTFNTSLNNLRVYDGVLLGGYEISNKTQNDVAYAKTTTSIIAGDGLNGGGLLTATRTLDVDSTVVRTSGPQTITGALTLFSTAVGTTGLAGTFRAYDFRDAPSDTLRWRTGADSEAETPLNEGSNFEVIRYSNTGQNLGTALQISRSNGSLTVYNNLAALANASVSGLLDVNNGINLNTGLLRVFSSGAILESPVSISGGVGTFRALDYRTTGDLLRFRLGINGTGEAGGNAGSDYDIIRYDDAGAFLGAAFRITRATGMAQCFNGLSVANGLTVTSGVITGDGAGLTKVLTPSTGITEIGSLVMGWTSGTDIMGPGTNRTGTAVTRALIGASGAADTGTAVGTVGQTWRSLGSVNATNRVTLYQRTA